MRFRLLLVCGLLLAVLAVPAGTAAAPSQRDQYVDPFAPEKNCRALRLPKRARGVKGNPFRVCVRALQNMQDNRRLSARRACRFESRRRVIRVRGKRVSPRGQCIAAGRRMRSRSR